MNAEATRSLPDAHPDLDAVWFGRGLAALRVFFGVILFANGIAKLFEFRRVAVGDY